MAAKRASSKENRAADKFFVVGCVVLAFALLIAGAGFFLGNLDSGQRLILSWGCSLAAGFAAGSFAGSAYLSYQVNTTTAGNVLVVTTSGFVVWLITFYFLYQAIGPLETTSAVVAIDEETKENIEGEYTVNYVKNSEPRSERCRGADTIELYPLPDVGQAQYKGVCRGYSWVGSSIVADKLQITMRRNEDFLYSIQPEENLLLDSRTLQLAKLPNLAAVDVTPKVKASDVKLTCKNQSTHFLDVILWHYPPPGYHYPGGDDDPYPDTEFNPVAMFAADRQHITAKPIPPNGGVASWDAFSLTPGYFLVLVSWRGRKAMLACEGNLYATATPTLIFKNTDDGNGVSGVFMP